MLLTLPKQQTLLVQFNYSFLQVLLLIPNNTFCSWICKILHWLLLKGISNLCSVFFPLQDFHISTSHKLMVCIDIKILPRTELAFVNIYWLFMIALHAGDIKMSKTLALHLRNSWCSRIDSLCMWVPIMQVKML